MKKLAAALLCTFIFLAGCNTKNEGKSAATVQPANAENPSVSIQPTTNTDDPGQPVASFLSKSDHIFSSIPPASNVYWVLLASDPALGQMGKTLYKTEDNGKSWVFVNDVSQAVDGYVTGVSFRDDKNGWIAATQHGTAMLPLYRTEDGGKSWSVQKIDIPEGYKYGNVYPPVFDEKDPAQGTLKIDFMSDSNKKTVEFKTTNGGETWVF